MQQIWFSNSNTCFVLIWIKSMISGFRIRMSQQLMNFKEILSHISWNRVRARKLGFWLEIFWNWLMPEVGDKISSMANSIWHYVVQHCPMQVEPNRKCLLEDKWAKWHSSQSAEKPLHQGALRTMIQDWAMRLGAVPSASAAHSFLRLPQLNQYYSSLFPSTIACMGLYLGISPQCGKYWLH